MLPINFIYSILIVSVQAAITAHPTLGAETADIYFSQFRRLEVQDQVPASSGPGEGSLPCLLVAVFLLCPHKAEIKVTSQALLIRHDPSSGPHPDDLITQGPTSKFWGLGL